jgi:hypothetical protein
MEPPRCAQQRKSDTLSRLAADIDGTGEPVDDDETKDAFAAKHDWDPRKESGDYAYFRIVPDRVQAWREVNELPGRTLMRDGRWLT